MNGPVHSYENRCSLFYVVVSRIWCSSTNKNVLLFRPSSTVALHRVVTSDRGGVQGTGNGTLILHRGYRRPWHGHKFRSSSPHSTMNTPDGKNLTSRFQRGLHGSSVVESMIQRNGSDRRQSDLLIFCLDNIG